MQHPGLGCRGTPSLAKGIKECTNAASWPKLGEANALDVKTCRLILAELEATVSAMLVRVLRAMTSTRQGSQ